MSIYAIKPQFQKCLEPIANICVKHHISADALNIAGVLFAILSGVSLFGAKCNNLFYLAIPLFLFARIASNALDGMVARKSGISSRRGSYFNELFDRISDVVLFTLIILSGHGSVIVGTLALAVTVLVSFSGTLTLAAGGRRIYSGIMGKPDRMFVIGTVSVLAFFAVPLIWEIGLWIVVLGGIVTIALRISQSIKELSDESL